MYPEMPSNQLYLELVKKFDSPIFVYDSERIIARYQRLMHAFKEVPVSIKYAMKALPSLAVLQLLQEEGCGIDAVSVEELKLALRAGCDSSQITFTPSCPRFAEIEEGVGQGVDVTLDSLPLLEKYGQKIGSSYPCAIRVRPEIAAGANAKIQTGHSRSKFGISLKQFSKAVELIEKYSIQLKGLHVHTGSDISDPEVFVASSRVLFEVAKQFPSLEYLDFGGGFKVSYYRDQDGVDLEEVARRFSEEYRSFSKLYGRELEVRFEPGKFLVSDAGVFLVNVSVVKESPEECFLGVNSGLNHLIRPMFYGSHHEIWNASGEGRELRPYTVVGYICEEDTFAQDRMIEEVREGDVLVFANAGAYCYSMSSNYNSRLRPAEVLIRNGEAKLIRAREDFDDLLRGQVPLQG